ncbi:MAG: hypothetical protein LBT97_03095 [Planctomycetota bacterium]|jgi:hypothetical protein|nr:hypothetical protein [Planctomycetota bacterium]
MCEVDEAAGAMGLVRNAALYDVKQRYLRYAKAGVSRIAARIEYGPRYKPLSGPVDHDILRKARLGTVDNDIYRWIKGDVCGAELEG